MNEADDPKAWRRFADMDMEAARVLNRDERLEALAAVVCFHAYQAAEKYLKKTPRWEMRPSRAITALTVL